MEDNKVNITPTQPPLEQSPIPTFPDYNPYAPSSPDIQLYTNNTHQPTAPTQEPPSYFPTSPDKDPNLASPPEYQSIELNFLSLHCDVSQDSQLDEIDQDVRPEFNTAQEHNLTFPQERPLTLADTIYMPSTVELIYGTLPDPQLPKRPACCEVFSTFTGFFACVAMALAASIGITIMWIVVIQPLMCAAALTIVYTILFLTSACSDHWVLCPRICCPRTTVSNPVAQEISYRRPCCINPKYWAMMMYPTPKMIPTTVHHNQSASALPKGTTINQKKLIEHADDILHQLPPLLTEMIAKFDKYKKYTPELYMCIKTWDLKPDSTNPHNDKYITHYITHKYVQVPITTYVNVSQSSYEFFVALHEHTKRGDVTLLAKPFLAELSDNDLSTVAAIKDFFTKKYQNEATYCNISLHFIVRDISQPDKYNPSYTNAGSEFQAFKQLYPHETLQNEPVKTTNEVFEVVAQKLNNDYKLNGTVRTLKIYHNHLAHAHFSPQSSSSSIWFIRPQLESQSVQSPLDLSGNDDLTTFSPCVGTHTTGVLLSTPSDKLQYYSSNYHMVRPLWYHSAHFSLDLPRTSQPLTARTEVCHVSEEGHNDGSNTTHTIDGKTIKLTAFSSPTRRSCAMCCTHRFSFLFQFLTCTIGFNFCCYYKRGIYVNYPSTYQVELCSFDEWILKYQTMEKADAV